MAVSFQGGVLFGTWQLAVRGILGPSDPNSCGVNIKIIFKYFMGVSDGDLFCGRAPAPPRHHDTALQLSLSLPLPPSQAVFLIYIALYAEYSPGTVYE